MPRSRQTPTKMRGMRNRVCTARLILHLFLVLFAWPGLSSSAEPALRGRPLTEVLAELEGDGIRFIYSSQLLPPTLRVTAEPASGDRLEIAREILAPHGLELSTVSPGLYAVVRQLGGQVEGLIRGRIVDAASGKPIHGARIEVLPRQVAQSTDTEGRFVIQSLPAGTYSLSIAAQGYAQRRLQEVEVPGEGTELDIALQPHSVSLADVVVATSRYSLAEPSVNGAFLFSGVDLQEQPAIGEDALRTLARLPGIAQSGVSARSNVRGGEANEVLVLLDGFPLRQPFHVPAYQGLFSVIDPGLIETAEVFTGGFPARYGNRMSGVFDLETLRATSEPHRALGLSFFNATAREGGRIESAGIEYLGAVRVGMLKPLLQAFSPGAGDPSYSDVYARISHQDVGGFRLSGNFLWARDELGISARTRGESAQIDSRSRYAWLRADKDWSRQLASSLWIGHSRIDSVRFGEVDDPGFARGMVNDSRASQFWDFRGQLRWHPRPSHWFETGFEWTDESATYHYQAEAEYSQQVADLFGRSAAFTRDADIKPARDRAALFATYRWRVTDSITTETGLRLQRILTRGAVTDWMEDPRLSVRWQVAPQTSLRVHWGRFHQADEIQELAVEDGVLVFPLAQRTDQFIVGLDHRLANGVALRVEGFRKDQSTPRPRFENALNVLSILPEIAPDRIRLAPDFAEVRGLEVSASLEDPQLRRWISLGWSDARDKFMGQKVPRSWDQTWAITAGLEMRRGAWQFGAVATAHRGWPTTALQVEPDGTFRLGPRNGSRLPTYASIDLRAEYQRPFGGGVLTYGAEVSNALDRSNTCCIELSGAEDGRLSVRDLSWLPLVPSLHIRWER